MVPIRPLQWYRLKRYVGTDSSATVVPIRRYYQDYYDAACLYAEMGEQKKALNYLRESLHRGFRRFAHIHRDRMLDNIRNLPAFEELLKEYEAIHAEEVKLSFVLPSSEFYLQSIDGLLTMQ